MGVGFPMEADVLGVLTTRLADHGIVLVVHGTGRSIQTQIVPGGIGMQLGQGPACWPGGLTQGWGLA